MPHRQNQEKNNMDELLQYQMIGMNNDWYSSRYNTSKSPGISEMTSNQRNDGSISRISIIHPCFIAIFINIWREMSLLNGLQLWCSLGYSFLLYDRINGRDNRGRPNPFSVITHFCRPAPLLQSTLRMECIIWHPYRRGIGVCGC